MKILIDTHTLLWLFTDDASLSKKAKEIYLNTENKLYVSIASLWELSIKASLGKLKLKKNWFPDFLKQLEDNSITWLAIAPEHCREISTLPFHHRDPFDRMLVCQAMVEKMKILTCDSHMKDYEVECVW